MLFYLKKWLNKSSAVEYRLLLITHNHWPLFMAIFFPKLQFIDNDTPYSERIALTAFEKALPDDFYIYHSFSFLEKKLV